MTSVMLNGFCLLAYVKPPPPIFEQKVSSWMEYQPRLNGKYMPALHYILSFEKVPL